jgi:flagellin
MNVSQHSLALANGLGRVDSRLDTVSARISSGRRIDRPAVDSPAVGQAARLEAERERIDAAEVNIQNGVSRLQVTSGQLGALGRLVTRLSELSALGTNALQSTGDRALYRAEFRQLQEQLRQVVGGGTAEIGGMVGVGRPQGSFGESALFGPGPGESLVLGAGPEDRITLPVVNLRQGAVGDLLRQDATGEFIVGLGDAPSAALDDTLRGALTQLATAQSEVGAGQSRLQLAAGVAATAGANHEAALSTIQDANLATETTELARMQILEQSHTAMLAQARDVTAKLLPLLARR